MSVESAASNKGDSIEFTLENPEVSTKYQTAAVIANKALQTVLDACKDGADIFELCKLGDDTIIEETGKVYNKRVKKDDKDKEGKKVEKGIGFPTCVSVGEVAGHFSPLKGESQVMKAGEVVKVDLGVQIDGFIAQAAHTIVVGGEEKVSDRRADVVRAAWTAAEAAVRMMQVGNKNSQVTEVMEKAAAEFKCSPVPGVLSHEVKRHVMDGQNCIISKESINDDQRVDEFTFEVNTAFTLDVMMSTGDGKCREKECRHTVYKRAQDQQYLLKTAKARQFIGEVNKRFPSLPFSLRNIEDEQCARVGVSEAKRHALLHEYPVLTERQGENIAQFKFTVLLLPGGTKKITGLALGQDAALVSEHSVQDEALKKLLAQSIAPRKKKANKKKEGEAKEE